MTKEDALLDFRLAPLKARRDMGMLGVIHRAVFGEGTDHHGRESERRHNKQLETFCKGSFLDIAAHSILGLVDVYNLLPTFMVEATTVKEFQKRLQRMMCEIAEKQITELG